MTTELTDILICDVQPLPKHAYLAVTVTILAGKLRTGMWFTDSQHKSRWYLKYIGHINYKPTVPRAQRKSLIGLEPAISEWELRPDDRLIEISQSEHFDVVGDTTTKSSR